jgi:hypothetical protein
MQNKKKLSQPARIALIILVIGIIVWLWIYSHLFLFNLWATSQILWLAFPLFSKFLHIKNEKKVELALKIVSTLLLIIFVIDFLEII